MLRKQLLLSLAVFTTFIGIRAMEDMSDRALVPHAYGAISVMHDKKGFAVSDGITSQRVQNCFVDKEMRGLSNEKLAKYLAAGNYLRVNKTEDDQYVLKASGRLQAGGLIAASQAYWITKAGLYGALGLAVGATIVATGGAVAAAGTAVAAGTATAGTVASGIGAGIAGATVGSVACGSTAAGIAVGTATATAAVVGGAEAAAATAAIATGASAVATVSGAGAATAAGATGICAATAAAIETAAAAAFAAALVCPWTPW